LLAAVKKKVKNRKKGAVVKDWVLIIHSTVLAFFL
jgi:hypothetical protein